ncbi:MAG: glycosyltransferase family 2 protein [Lachnospiraceae bacterium]|nr:glycosyltransferase family 2 protein [Lachnospiraceae bacterium]
MKKLQILMSTYNGKAYLREQLDSVLQQDCKQKGLVKLQLLVRDDGSKDGTQKILQEYAIRYPQEVQWFQGENCGVIQSFFELMKKTEKADFYAFSDQDDFWMPDKMSSAIQIIEKYGKNRPFLYCCRPKLVDAELNAITSAMKRPAMRPSFGNALLENIVTGCTAVMNEELRALVAVRFPQFTVMHDRWFYLAASCFGRVYYDETPHICYRQHGGNVVGVNSGRWKEFYGRLRLFWGKRHDISRQAEEFIKIFGALPEREDLKEYRGDAKSASCLKLAKELVEGRKGFSKRLRLVKGKRLFRQRGMDDFIFRMLILLGIY